MRPDLRGALRRRKPDRFVQPLRPRDAASLPGIGDLGSGRTALLLDTNVYIHAAAGRLAPDIEAVLESGLLFHCSVCLAELATGVAAGNPRHRGWAATRDHYAELFETIPASRLLAPDPSVWIDAGLIAGTLARTQGLQPSQRKETLNDALIYLTAARFGIPVLTQNRVEFDLIQQIAPEGRFVCY